MSWIWTDAMSLERKSKLNWWVPLFCDKCAFVPCLFYQNITSQNSIHCCTDSKNFLTSDLSKPAHPDFRLWHDLLNAGIPKSGEVLGKPVIYFISPRFEALCLIYESEDLAILETENSNRSNESSIADFMSNRTWRKFSFNRRHSAEL